MPAAFACEVLLIHFRALIFLAKGRGSPHLGVVLTLAAADDQSKVSLSADGREAKGWSWPGCQGPLPLGKLLPDFYTLALAENLPLNSHIPWPSLNIAVGPCTGFPSLLRTFPETCFLHCCKPSFSFPLCYYLTQGQRK